MEYLKFIPEGWIENKEDYKLDFIKNAYKTGEIIQGKVYDCDSYYNLHIKLGNNIEGVIPRNEVEFFGNDDFGYAKTSICKNKLNSYVQFKIKEIYNDNKVILSRKNANEEAYNWMQENLKEGMIVKGIVRNIRDYGAFIEIGAGVVGLLSVGDISISRIKSPKERFFIGQKINVMIKSIDKEDRKIFFSYKELCGTWEENIKGISERSIIKGKIKDTDKYKNGIFIELKPNLVGLAEYKDGYQYGQTVDVYIKKIIKEKKKIKLVIV